MKNLRFLVATALGGAAVFACDSAPESEPAASTTSAASTTGAGPVTNAAAVTNSATMAGPTATTATATTGAAAQTVAGTTDATTVTTATTGGTSTTGAAATTGVGGATAMTVAGDATSTTGSGSCVGTAAATAAVPITPADGWVDCATNAIGLQGSFFTYSDGTSTVEPADFSAAGSEICVNGMAAASGTDIWGAGVGFNLNQDVGSDDPNEWDATAAGISGISFNISALPTGGLVRLIYSSAGIDYCVQIEAAGEQTVAFADTAEECWAETPGGAPPATTLEAVKWQVAAVTDAYTFDFCISDIQAVP